MFLQKSSAADYKLQALSDSHAMIEFTPQGEILSANEQFLKALGYGSLEEIRGRHHSLFVDPNERETPEYRQFWERLRAGHHATAEFRRIRKDGSDVWIQASYVPVCNSRGQVASVIKIASDITERKMQSFDYEGQILGINATQAVIHFDTQGTILDANDLFCSTMKCRKDEIVGQHHSIFVSPEERAGVMYQDFWKKLARGEGQMGEFHRIAKDGSNVWIRASYTPIRDNQGRVFKVVKYAMNVTDQVEKRHERQRLQALIEQDLTQISNEVDHASDLASGAAGAAGDTTGKVQDVAGGVEELSESIREISSQVNRALDISRTAVNQADHTNGLVEGLVTAVGQIDKVVRLINDIAGQTNLLALNATIEAARAGEAGKGFAVVANEVKGLATQTTKATEEIGNQISAVQDATKQAVEAIRAISTTIAQVNEISANIAAAVEEQTSVTQGIADSMQTAAESVDQVSQSLNDIAASSVRINDATLSVREAARKAM